MEREINDSVAIRFKKTGGGSLRWNGRIIKPNEIFMARPEEVPFGFRNVVVPLDPIPEDSPIIPGDNFKLAETPAKVGDVGKKTDEPEKPDSLPEGDYIVAPKGAGGWYDVINIATGKAINTKALREGEAGELLKELNP